MQNKIQEFEYAPAQYLDLHKLVSVLTPRSENGMPATFEITENYLLDCMNKLFRFNHKGMRNYVTVENDVQIYQSVTSIIDKIMPSDFLINKRGEMGNKAYFEWLNELARMGTFIHIKIADYMLTHEFNIDMLYYEIEQYFYENRYQYDAWLWHRIITPKIISMIGFVKDYNVKPIAIEMPVYHAHFGYAGMLDLLCELDVEYKVETGEKHKNGRPVYEIQYRREIALIDFKSGTSGQYLSYKLQLQMYFEALKYMFNADFKGHVKLINVMPKEWKQGNLPNYQVYTQNYNSSLIAMNVKQAMDFWNRVRCEFMLRSEYDEQHKEDTITVFKGSLNSKNTVEDCVIEMPLTQYIMGLKKISNYQNNQGN